MIIITQISWFNENDDDEDFGDQCDQYLGRKTIIIVIIIRKLWFNWIDQTISSSPSSWWLWSLKLMTIMRMSILVKVVCPLSNLSIHEYVPHILRQNCLIPMKIPHILRPTHLRRSLWSDQCCLCPSHHFGSCPPLNLIILIIWIGAVLPWLFWSDQPLCCGRANGESDFSRLSWWNSERAKPNWLF